MRQEEALSGEILCPFDRLNMAQSTKITCVGQKCMVWRWEYARYNETEGRWWNPNDDTSDEVVWGKTGKGYCGLGGLEEPQDLPL